MDICSAVCCWVLPGWAWISPMWEQLCSQPDSLEVHVFVNKLGARACVNGCCPVNTRSLVISGAVSQLVGATEIVSQP